MVLTEQFLRENIPSKPLVNEEILLNMSQDTLKISDFLLAEKCSVEIC